MQFHVTIDTTRAASFGLTHGLPAWVNKLDMEFELPNDWSRKECIDALSGYVRNVELMPYQNLADYEGVLELARGSFALAADDLPRRDVNEPVNFFFMQNHGTDGARVAITIREISYV